MKQTSKQRNTSNVQVCSGTISDKRKRVIFSCCSPAEYYLHKPPNLTLLLLEKFPLRHNTYKAFRNVHSKVQIKHASRSPGDAAWKLSPRAFASFRIALRLLMRHDNIIKRKWHTCVVTKISLNLGPEETSGKTLLSQRNVWTHAISSASSKNLHTDLLRQSCYSSLLSCWGVGMCYSFTLEYRVQIFFWKLFANWRWSKTENVHLCRTEMANNNKMLFVPKQRAGKKTSCNYDASYRKPCLPCPPLQI